MDHLLAAVAVDRSTAAAAAEEHRRRWCERVNEAHRTKKALRCSSLRTIAAAAAAERVVGANLELFRCRVTSDRIDDLVQTWLLLLLAVADCSVGWMQGQEMEECEEGFRKAEEGWTLRRGW